VALAVRAGLPLGDLGQVTWRDGEPFRFTDAVRGDGRGQVGVPGVAACGETLSVPWHTLPELALLEDAVRGLEAGSFQAAPPGRADPEMVPAVDDAMPSGFAEGKLERLRATLSRCAGPRARREDLERGEAEVLSLRGEFADYARARVATDVHVLHQAADLALAHVVSRLRPPTQPDARVR
jgi:L-aspartate oxidase